MFSTEKEIIINLPLVESWEKLRNIKLAEHYIPGVEKIDIVTEQAEGVGASRLAFLNDGRIVNEDVIHWTDGESFTLRLHIDGKRALPFYDEFHFHYHIEPSGDNTLFRPAILYTPRLKIFKRLQSYLHNYLMGRQLIVICAAMKEYYETGNPISPERMDAIKKAVL